MMRRSIDNACRAFPAILFLFCAVACDGADSDGGADSDSGTDPGECVPEGEWGPVSGLDYSDLFQSVWVAPSGLAHFTRWNGSEVATYDGESWAEIAFPDWVAPEVTGYGGGMNGSLVWGLDEQDILVSAQGSFGLGALVQKSADDWSVVWSFTSLGNVWVAEDGTAYAAGIPRLLHYDGAAWTPVDDPILVSWIIDVWGSSPDDVYVSGLTPGQDPAIFHFDGASWTDITGEVGANYMVHFWGSAPDDVFAADSGIVHHFDGVDWEWLSVSDNHFNRIWGSGPGDVFTVGSRVEYEGEEDQQVHYPTIWHYDGSAWTEVAGEWQDDPDDEFRWVGGSGPDDVYAITGTGLSYHFDGGSFSPIDLGGARALWGSAANDLYAVGDEGMALHFDGASWTEIDSATSDDLVAIHGNTSGDVVAVGGYGTATHGSTGGWIEELHDHCHRTTGIGATPDAYYIVCANPGWVFRWDGSTWDEHQVEGVWTSVWGAADGTVWVAGYEETDGGSRRGLLGRFDGVEWSVLQPEAPADLDYSLEDVWADGTGVVIAVGAVSGDPAGGVIVALEGGTWNVETGFEGGFRSVWGSSSDDVYAIGDGGLIAHFDGSAWSIREECLGADLYTIHGSESSNVFMMGDIEYEARIYSNN